MIDLEKTFGLILIMLTLGCLGAPVWGDTIFRDNWNDLSVQTPAFASPGVDWTIESGAFSADAAHPTPSFVNPISGTLMFDQAQVSRISVNFGATTAMAAVEARFKLYQSNGGLGSGYVFAFGLKNTASGKSHVENGTLSPGYYDTSGFHGYWSGSDTFKAGLAGASYSDSWNYMKMLFNPTANAAEVWQAIDGIGTKAYDDSSLPWRMVASWDNNYANITSVDQFFLQNSNAGVSWQVDDVEIQSLANIDPTTFTPDGGWYTQVQNVIVSCPTPGAVIRYTTDGSDPTLTTGTLIASGSSVLVDRVMTLKAQAWSPGYATRNIKTADYKVYTEPWVPKPLAVQTIYRNGVPHTDSNGNFRLTYDPLMSFFPISHYEVWVGTVGTETWSFTDFANAGFNSALMRHVSSVTEADAAQSAGIKLLFTQPTDAQINQLKNHPATLGYRMYDEPTDVYWSNDMAGHYQSFLTRMAEVKALDPVHPFYTLDVPWITEPATSWWVQWNTAGDVSSHDNYPIYASTMTTSFSQGIPETVSLAVSSNNQNKPVWFVPQAFGYASADKWTIPTPAQERSMVYTSIIHGATGMMYFILDSYASRDAGCIGMAPNPKTSYSLGVSATNTQLRASKALWFGVKSLNAELAALRPAILSPTSTTPYEVYLSNTLPYVSENPIRTLLKDDPAGGQTLLLANVDGAPQIIKIRFPNNDFAVQELYGNLGFTRSGDCIELSCPAWDTRILRILAPQTINTVKTLADGTGVACSGIVSAIFTDHLWVESPDRSHGIRVNKTNHGATLGQVVNVGGAISTLSSGERYIIASDVSSAQQQ